MHRLTKQIDPIIELDDAIQNKRDGLPVWQWFSNRVRSHNQAMSGVRSQSFRGSDAGTELQRRLAIDTVDRPRVLYVHIPFCQKICNFCAFIRSPFNSAAAQYVEVLINQLKSLSKTTWAQSRPFDAVFIGGGTPTSLSTEQLCRIVDTISSHYPLSMGYEFTVEARFEGLDEDYLKGLDQTAVNRLSFGVQSFDTKLRQSIGRIASREPAIALLDEACSRSFNSVSVDLIYNLPAQTMDVWESDLNTLQSSKVSGVSAYTLIPFPDSALMKMIERGDKPPLAGIDSEFGYYHTTCSFLNEANGWNRISPFHFGRDKETCVYNESRLGISDILGVGSGAGGSVNGLSYMNCMDTESYLRQSTDGSNVTFASAKPQTAVKSSFAYQLVTRNGINESLIQNQLPFLQPVVDRLIELELVGRGNGVYALTNYGNFWSYNITSFITRTIAKFASEQSASVESQQASPSNLYIAETSGKREVAHAHSA